VSNKPKIDELIHQQLAFKGLTEEEFQIWGDRVEQAVENANVVHMSAASVAKL
jgi:hypothetical protein